MMAKYSILYNTEYPFGMTNNPLQLQYGTNLFFSGGSTPPLALQPHFGGMTTPQPPPLPEFPPGAPRRYRRRSRTPVTLHLDAPKPSDMYNGKRFSDFVLPRRLLFEQEMPPKKPLQLPLLQAARVAVGVMVLMVVLLILLVISV